MRHIYLRKNEKPDITELVEYKINALLFKAGSVEDLKQKIKYAIENSEEIKKMAFRGREKYLKKYHYQKSCSIIGNVYKIAIKSIKEGKK